MEEIPRIPASEQLASDSRYSQGATERPLVLLLSQSGETADPLGAAREAHRRGCKTLAISNVIGASLSREVDKTIYTRAGIEIGVAATKTFIAQLVVLYLIALKLGQDRGTLGYDELDRLKDQLRSLPRAAQYVLNKADEIRALAAKYGRDTKDMFYIGRHANYPVAMEGALKIKEISYIHAEAYAAGELKHGPLALLTSSTPVIAVVTQDPTYEKMRSNVGEVSARGSPVLAIGTEGDKELPKFVDDVIEIPSLPWIFSPVPVSVALQLFAYEAARIRNCPIDKPRNLAKSVTVEYDRALAQEPLLRLHRHPHIGGSFDRTQRESAARIAVSTDDDAAATAERRHLPEQLGPGDRVVPRSPHLRGNAVVPRGALDPRPVFGVSGADRPRGHRVPRHDPDPGLGVCRDDGPGRLVLRCDGLDRGRISRRALGLDAARDFRVRDRLPGGVAHLLVGGVHHFPSPRPILATIRYHRNARAHGKTQTGELEHGIRECGYRSLNPHRPQNVPCGADGSPHLGQNRGQVVADGAALVSSDAAPRISVATGAAEISPTGLGTGALRAR